MNERIRKYLGWGLIGLGVITGLIIPWIIGYGIYSKIKTYREERNQIETAKTLGVHYTSFDPYRFIFIKDGEEESSKSLRDRVIGYQRLAEEEPEAPGFFKRFYNNAIGFQEEESKSQKMLRDAYESKMKSLKTSNPQKMFVEQLKDIYQLLKTKFGRGAFGKVQYFMVRESVIQSSPTKIASRTDSKLKRSPPQTTLRKIVLLKRQKISEEERVRALFRNTKDKWRKEPEGKPVNEGKTLKI